jgi:hypothetical protein
MRHLLRAGAVFFSFGAVSIGGVLRADPIPLPNVDYQAKATMMGGSAVTIRHSGGKLRMEIQPPGLGQTIVGIMDLASHKMVLLGSVPGISNMAMEIDVGKDASYGQVMGEGKRAGSASAAGESCELWEVDGKAAFNTGPVTTCIGRDNIPLRTEALIEGKPRTVMEVTELQRTKQDPALFALPANVQVIKMPKGAAPAAMGAPAKQ